MKKGITIIFLMMLIPVLGVMAGGSGEDVGGEEPVTVTYLTWDSGPGVEITKPIIAAFEDEILHAITKMNSNRFFI